MEKYRLLLADDEEVVVRTIMKKIDWNSLGFEVIGYAENGIKTLEMVEELRPDVIMTDIKMPYMDGMELSRRVKKDYPTIKILIFTGFDEFEYAKEAVHLEIEEYILKPINSVELTKVFTRLKENLDREFSERRDVEILKSYYIKSLPVIQTAFFSGLIEGKIPKDEIENNLKDYDISLSGPYYCILSMYSVKKAGSSEINPIILTTSVQKLAEDRLGEGWRAYSFLYLGNVIMLVQLSKENEITELTDECEKLSMIADRMLDSTLTIGIGRLVSRIEDIPNSYLGAKEAISYRVIYGSDCAININEIEPKDTVKTDIDAEEKRSFILQNIRFSDEENVKKAVYSYVEYIMSFSDYIRQYSVEIMDLIGMLSKFYINNNIENEELSSDIGTLFNRIVSMQKRELEEWLLNISLDCNNYLSNVRDTSTKTYIERAKEYIHNNYSREDISLEKVCEMLNVSNSYFSTIFKKETGSSFTQYITSYRMEKAAKLLTETNEKSYSIANSVGYSDANYFSYVFKRYFGVSPSRYKSGERK